MISGHYKQGKHQENRSSLELDITWTCRIKVHVHPCKHVFTLLMLTLERRQPLPLTRHKRKLDKHLSHPPAGFWFGTVSWNLEPRTCLKSRLRAMETKAEPEPWGYTSKCIWFNVSFSEWVFSETCEDLSWHHLCPNHQENTILFILVSNSL